jgi:FkbM family methyltransferase
VVDANEDALRLAVDTLLKNGFSTNIRMACAFVSDANDEPVDFFTVGTGAAGSRYVTHAVTAASRGEKRTISTVTIDRLVSEFEVVPTLIKVDVEGAEVAVLRGGTETARLHRSRWCVEMHAGDDARPMRSTAADVITWCGSVDYVPYYLKEHQPLVDPETVAHRGRCHLLLLPREQKYPEWLRRVRQGASFEEGLLARNGGADDRPSRTAP